MRQTCAGHDRMRPEDIDQTVRGGRHGARPGRLGDVEGGLIWRTMSVIGWLILAIVVLVVLAVAFVIARRRRRGGGVIATRTKTPGRR
jgi:hypothetical protein